MAGAGILFGLLLGGPPPDGQVPHRRQPRGKSHFCEVVVPKLRAVPQVRQFCAVCSSCDPLLAGKYLAGANGDLDRAIGAFLLRTQALTKSPLKRPHDAEVGGSKKQRTDAQGVSPPDGVVDDPCDVVTIADSSDEGEGGQEDRPQSSDASATHPLLVRSVVASSVEAFDRTALNRQAAALLGPAAFSLSHPHLEEAAAATEECWREWRASAQVVY